MVQKKIRLTIPFLGVSQLSEIAHSFLQSTGQDDEPPVDVESICDRLNISVLTVPQLKRDLGIDSYISSDFKTIVVDEACFVHHVGRARFSIAHELAHMLLHKDVYELFKISNLDEYLKMQNSLHPDTEKRIEQQAYMMAGLILMPSNMVDSLLKLRLPADIDVLTINDMQKVLIECSVMFNVSGDVVIRRFKHGYPGLFEVLTNGLE